MGQDRKDFWRNNKSVNGNGESTPMATEDAPEILPSRAPDVFEPPTPQFPDLQPPTAHTLSPEMQQRVLRVQEWLGHRARVAEFRQNYADRKKEAQEAFWYLTGIRAEDPLPAVITEHFRNCIPLSTITTFNLALACEAGMLALGMQQPCWPAMMMGDPTEASTPRAVRLFPPQRGYSGICQPYDRAFLICTTALMGELSRASLLFWIFHEIGHRQHMIDTAPLHSPGHSDAQRYNALARDYWAGRDMSPEDAAAFEEYGQRLEYYCDLHGAWLVGNEAALKALERGRELEHRPEKDGGITHPDTRGRMDYIRTRFPKNIQPSVPPITRLLIQEEWWRKLRNLPQNSR